MIEDLLDPKSLPDATGTVRLLQTHISLVFVADAFVYKVKKPVDFGFLDFSTLEKREHFCRREVELNQRLSKDIYLDVMPVFRDGNHHRLGGGKGTVVEYAVRMRRIPETVLMKSLFLKGDLTGDMLRDIAHVLARFHQSADGSPEIDAFGEAAGFKINTDENFEQTERYVGKTLKKEDFQRLRAWTDAFYREGESLFRDRILEGKIRDCHGDLHMEHICLTDPVSVIDCIEFNERFRYSDTLSDIAFLLMDLEYHDGKGPAEQFWKEYSEMTQEKGQEDLLTFYKVYRAYVRGKVISFQLDDPHVSGEEKENAARRASRY
ncbi:MAG: phosphotransferase, partial [Deltaproteobacteria bacterium]|nr:phosphotransferase [Deltaproteobacteria bacterium]